MASFLGSETVLTRVARDAANWWLKELAEMLPDALVQWLTDAGGRSLILAPSGKGVRLLLRNDRGRVLARRSADIDEELPGTIDRFLKSQRLRRRDVALGLALPAETFFFRDLILPREVGRSVEAVAFRDLLQNTPFRADDIHYGCKADRAGAQICVRQCVIRRVLFREAAQPLGLAPEAFAFVEAAESDGDAPPLPIRLHKDTRRNRWLQVAFACLTATCLIGALAAAAIQYHRQSAQLENLAAQISKARARAHEVRAALEASQKQQMARGELRRRKQENAKLLDVWEEVSRRLPDHAWAAEFKLTTLRDQPGYKITLSGFSSAAASLVEVLDTSTLFKNVALTAPISMDPVEKRERFVLEAVTVIEKAKRAP